MADAQPAGGTPEQDLLNWEQMLNQRLHDGATTANQPDLGLLINPTRRTQDLNELGAQPPAQSANGAQVRGVSDPNALLGYGGQILQGLQKTGPGGVPRSATDPATHPQYGNSLLPRPQPRRLQLPDGSSVTLTPVDHNPFAGVGT